MATYRSVAVNFPFLKNSKLDASMWDTEKGCHGILTAYWLSVRVRGFTRFWKNSKLDASMWDTEKGCHGILTAYWLSVRVRGLRGS